MSRRQEIYDHLATLLDYPTEQAAPGAEAEPETVRGVPTEVARRLSAYRAKLSELAGQAREELYTRTFDWSPKCCLDVGWHLYGENYERGRFLVWMRAQLRHFGLSESSELPDHLAQVLRVLGRMEDRAADELAHTDVLPALERILSALEGQGNPYEELLRAIETEIRLDHAKTRKAEPPLRLEGGRPPASHAFTGKSR